MKDKDENERMLGMKKLCCIILLATLLFAFTGCADLDEILDDEPSYTVERVNDYVTDITFH